MTAFINGKSASADVALDRAAEILGKAKAPVFAGMGADIAGAKAAIALAAQTGGVIDHMSSSILRRETRVMQDRHFFHVSPHEAYARADVILAVGPEAARHAAQLPLPAQSAAAAPARVIVNLCPGRETVKGEILGASPARLAGLIAALSAAAMQRPLPAQGYDGAALADIRRIAEKLAAARFGLALWSPRDLNALMAEALMGLIAALSEKTRFTALSLTPADNAAGVSETCLWMTGYPLRVGFGRGYAEHDAWRFDANRMIEAGESDAVVWISAFRPAAPPWKGGPPVIALTGPGAAFERAPDVHFNVGAPGIDHDGEFFDVKAGAILAYAAARPSDKMSAATLLDALALRLGKQAA